MRVLINDFGGYAFPLQLSEALAARGHTVLHTYCASLTTTPPGTDDTDTRHDLEVVGIKLSRPLQKYRFVARWRQEREYGMYVVQEIARYQPDVVISANTPLDAQRLIHRACTAAGIRFVFWLQDLIGIASASILTRKIPLLGRLIGRHYVQLERRLLNESDHLILISPDFEPIVRRAGVAADRTAVIQNWAPLDEITVGSKSNRWADLHELTATFNFLYAGTLSMKHNPELLLKLAHAFQGRPNVRVVVLSQGLGAGWLKEQLETSDPGNLLVMDFEPKAQMTNVLATADVLVAVLEPDASIFSVPSKVLSYLCAGRPTLLAVPPENLAARIVSESGAGCVVAPNDVDAFLEQALRLSNDAEERARMGRSAREYAESHFEIDHIADRFEKILTQMVCTPASTT